MVRTKFSTVFVFVLVLVILYVRAYYHSPCVDVEIGQTELSGLTDRVLLDRRPLIIVDRIINHQDLVKLSALRLLHVKSYAPYSCKHVAGSPHVVASARFTLLYQSHTDTSHIEVRHPYTLAGAVIVLRQHQTLILPPRWRFTCPDAVTVCELHDSVSLVLRALRVTKIPRQA